ncbi:MAG TPA: ATP-binding protein, partial [Armatimonadota bacterium]
PPQSWLAFEAEKRDIREMAWARQPFLQPGIFNPDGHPRHPLSVPTPWNQAAFRRSVSGQTVRMDADVKGARVRLLSAPVCSQGRVRAIIQMVRPLDEFEHMMGNLDRTLLALMLPALLVAGGAAAFLTGRSLRPVKQLAQATAQLTSQDLAYRLPLTGHDEFTELSRRFNGMAERLEGAFSQMEAANDDLRAAYERQRQFTADASHELRTPLTRVKTTASVALASDRSPESYRKALGAVNEASDAMTRLIDDLLLLARSDAGHLRMGAEPADLKQALAAATEMERAALGGRLRWELADEELEVAAAEDHLVRLFGNLLGNAARHTPPEGTITLAACRRNGCVLVQVKDTGEGIPEEHLPRVCERFYRVDAARTRELGGTGLGLAICQSIVAAYGGEMTLRSEVGQGTTVSVSLPAAPGATPAPSTAA